MKDIDKLKQLEAYRNAYERFYMIDENLKGVSSISYDYVRSTVHKSIDTKIHEKQKAYEQMIEEYANVSRMIDDSTLLESEKMILSEKYLFLSPDYKIADMLGIIKNGTFNTRKLDKEILKIVSKIELERVSTDTPIKITPYIKQRLERLYEANREDKKK